MKKDDTQHRPESPAHDVHVFNVEGNGVSWEKQRLAEYEQKEFRKRYPGGFNFGKQ